MRGVVTREEAGGGERHGRERWVVRVTVTREGTVGGEMHGYR